MDNHPIDPLFEGFEQTLADVLSHWHREDLGRIGRKIPTMDDRQHLLWSAYVRKKLRDMVPDKNEPKDMIDTIKIVHMQRLVELLEKRYELDACAE